MANRVSITAEELRNLLNYDPVTGEFRWKPRPREMFNSDRAYAAWFARFPGKIAGNTPAGDYGRINIGGRIYHTHRLAWLHHYGELPAEIDHIDGDRANNAISNLRAASHSQNACNTPIRKHNRLGVKNIYYDGVSYRVKLKIDRKLVFDKRFPTLEEAREAYAREAVRHQGEFARIT